ncbi:hypothetical protein CHS0354_033760 [Potamilus streckersoni]|uniref:UBA domain-containing protein n=1 Tax=Potamilus streckersoni TaxID=2493646 RepID=A0AAE0VNC4_9BIVA|nr:hypothetical protein CHS0354_033760 [Potamilus streckersoni]
MLEGLVAWVLNTYVGEYVENLNTDQLSIALLQGAVELENLPLKKDALRSLGLPLEVRKGFIGKITLQIPLRRLRSEPWVISMERLYLVAGPLQYTKYDEEKERKYQQERKAAMLEALEAKWQVIKQNKQEGYGASWFSYGTSVAANILENLQLKVQDVHIRYEDDQLNPACPFAFGVIIKKLSAQSTDGTWAPKFVSRYDADMMRKLVDLQNFAMYLDTNAVLLGDLTCSELADALHSDMYLSKATGQFKDHEYILSPISAQAKMTRNTSVLPLRSPVKPRITFDLILEKMGFMLNDEQYKNIILMLKEFDRYERRKPNLKWRPLVPVKESPRDWWMYAISAKLHVIQEHEKRRTKSYLIQRVQDVLLYHKGYYLHLAQENVDSIMKTQISRIEANWSYEELRIVRELAYHRVKQDGKLPKPQSVEREVEMPKVDVIQSQFKQQQQQESLFQRWFPGWAGWYGGSVAAATKSQSGTSLEEQTLASKQTIGHHFTEKDTEEPPPKISKSDLEQEIMGVLDYAEDKSLLKRDMVFAKLNFCLDSGSFKLLGSKESATTIGEKVCYSIIELECTAINVMFESCPRTSAMKFGISIGGLVLLDKMTEKTNFPCLIGSKNKDHFISRTKSEPLQHGIGVSKVSGSKSMPIILDGSSEKNRQDSKIFELMYEKNPVETNAKYRFHLKTEPLDLVYNREAVERIQEFFSTKRITALRSSDLHLKSAARRQYEMLKRQTREELKHTLDQMLDGRNEAGLKRWEIQLDVSAPQIILPENFNDPSTSLVILDLGNVKLHNTALKSHTVSFHSDMEDDFHTPMSTPPNEPALDTNFGSLSQNLQLSELHNIFYERYSLELTDLQVMVGRMKDNWRNTQFRGSTQLHLVDKFSITLQLERKLIFTNDPQWPNITVSGTLPRLTVHVNEQKVQILHACMKLLSQPILSTPQPSSNIISLSSSTSGLTIDESGQTISQEQTSESILDVSDRKIKENMVESQLLLMQFTINQVSLEIQSRERAVAELQVSQVKANLTKRPFDTAMSLSIHSLLVVDALQQFGQDFELLVASHKSLVLDSTSGSLCGSDPVSPRCPGSPEETLNPLSSTNSATHYAVQEAVVRAYSMISGGGYKSSGPSPGNPSGECTHSVSLTPDKEALICLEFQIISPLSPSNAEGEGTLHIANFQFNSLDIIANQETLVEIVSFLKMAVPSSKRTHSSKVLLAREKSITNERERILSGPRLSRGNSKIEVTADFNRLSVLMMRIQEDSQGLKMARKVATATLCGARLRASIDNEIKMDGSLDGFHVFDITPEGQKHQIVFSLGQDTSDVKSAQIYSPIDMFKTASESVLLDDSEVDHKAFSLRLNKPRFERVDVSSSISDAESITDTVKVKLKMASLCYTHSARLIHELSQCVSEFKVYMTSVADSIKNAAAEVAKGIVAKQQMFGHKTFHCSTNSLDGLGTSQINLSQSEDETCETEFLNKSSCLEDNLDDDEFNTKRCIVLKAHLESPVIVFPRSPISSEVLVGHLGQISLSNSPSHNLRKFQDSILMHDQEKNTVFVMVRNMNLYSVNLDNCENVGSSVLNLQRLISVSCVNGVPIIHDTKIEVTIDHIVPDVKVINLDTINDFPLSEESASVIPDESFQAQDSQITLDFRARIATPLNIVLSKQVYEQILQTVENISYTEPKEFELNLRNLNADVVDGKTDSVRITSLEGSSLGLKNLNSSDFSIGSTTRSRSGTSQSKFITKKVKFEVPLFKVEMRGDFGEGEQGLVDLNLHEFSLNYYKNHPATTKFELSLKSLVMDDLLEEQSSPHRQIMVSKAPVREDSHINPKIFLSSSCPESMILAPIPILPPSLPTSFHNNLEGMSRLRPKLTQRSFSNRLSSRGPDYPSTPTCKPRHMTQEVKSRQGMDENLVHVNVLLVDKASPEYYTKYKQTKRFIDVDFSCLETTINLQTWVVLLDFLGLGAKVHDIRTMENPSKKQTEEKSGESVPVQLTVNSEINLKIESLSILLNKTDYELARASISRLSSLVTLRDGNFAMLGQLGSMALSDLSPHGYLYRERFMTVGEQALEFDFFRYGVPDPWLHREYDAKLKLRMASVQYVHTNRFQSETLAFCQHFLQLQDILGRMRAASDGKKINETAFHSPRLFLDVEAKSPIIIIPHSSKTADVLVMDLGIFSVKNCFKMDGDEGTLKNKYAKEHEEKAQEQEKSSREQQQQRSRSTSQSNFLVGTDNSDIPQPMTQSLYDDLLPSGINRDPMTDSIYGRLDHDMRSEQGGSLITVRSVKSEIYNASDVEGSSIDYCTSDENSLIGISSDSAVFNPGVLNRSWGYPVATQSEPLQSSQMAADRRVTFACSQVLSVDSIFPSSDSDSGHVCLLDVMIIKLTDIDLYSALRVEKRNYNYGHFSQDLEFPSCIIKKEGKPLKEKCLLELQVERNLEGDLSHVVPDWRVSGALSSVHFTLDVTQYKLIRGILDHNFGEKLEMFQRPLMTHLQDPKIQTVLTGRVWKMISMVIDLHNVTVELLSQDQDPQHEQKSLARLDFISSRLSYDSFSDQSKEVDLVSHEIVASDTRFKDVAHNQRHSVFEKILLPTSETAPDSLQMELHFRASKDGQCFLILLNNMKLMCIFDWLLLVHKFLMTNAENPFQGGMQNQAADSASHQTSMQSESEYLHTRSPLTTSGGIVTKRGPVIEQTEIPFELKLNVTETQFVVVENMASSDTNAVVVKCTAVLSFRPKAQDKLLSCNLQRLEVFSCSLSAETDTALSIVDPMTITVELNANPLPELSLSSSSGLQDAKNVDEQKLLMEVSFNTMNIRLSYNDLQLFLAILNSLPKQTLQARQKGGSDLEKEDEAAGQIYGEFSIKKLEELGFERRDCIQALKESRGHVAEAAIWLTENAQIKHPARKDELNITGIELRAMSICLCLIDDCKDVDVPLAELGFSNVNFSQKLHPTEEGKAMFQIQGHYYNRRLSGWEPFLELWRCLTDWRNIGEGKDKKLAIQIVAPDVLNINLTPTLIELYNRTKVTWTEDYYMEKEDSQQSSGFRRRQPYTPFVICNQTGCQLWFFTVTTTPSSVMSTSLQKGQKEDEAYLQASKPRCVQPKEEVPFSFYQREKMRHKKTHSLSVNQLVVKVEGWKKLSPVSVDKVGIYFRYAEPERPKASNIMLVERQPARIVFEVQQEGNARKVITLRSALIIKNKLDSPLEVGMKNQIIHGRYETFIVDRDKQMPVPLNYIYSELQMRPSNWLVGFCKTPVEWQHVEKMGEICDSFQTCENAGTEGKYRFCVSIRRENYPEESAQDKSIPLPCHVLTVVPPLIVSNLLPIDMNYYLQNTDIKGTVRPGKDAQIHAFDIHEDIILGICLENFPHCRELMIPAGTTKYRVKLRLYDLKNRLLELTVHILARPDGPVRLMISAPYWLINKSGLPLIFKQDFLNEESAGQFDEHELARSVTPLLFSFSSKDSVYKCCMRIGNSVHGVTAKSQFSKGFSLDSGVGMCQLHVTPQQANKPDWLYYIGVDVQMGKGRYRKTNFVTFAPRYELDNQSNHKLAICQRQFTGYKSFSADGYLTVFPKSKLPFHWPRVDLDQLLCVKTLDVEYGWSGGFRIDQVDSFHINMRDEKRNSFLMKVEIFQQGPTFVVMFRNAEETPPPFRIDNLSEIPVLYFQGRIQDETLQAFVKPNTSLAYAWDEPTEDHILTLSVLNGTMASYSMDRLEEGEKLYYQNFIYIQAAATFQRRGHAESDQEMKQLVMESTSGNYIVFKKKEAGNRNQLWRMTSSGMLEHEGSMPPSDPRKSTAFSQSRMVLDIADLALQPGKPVPLILKKPDDRRKAMQTWNFTKSGLLCCSTGNLCVQAVPGLEDGAIAVLGPGPSINNPDEEILAHMIMSPEKLRPGSGVLLVRVIMDGPIRVLQIADMQQRKVTRIHSKEEEDWEIYEENLEPQSVGSQSKKVLNMELSLNLKGGIGISLVNKVPEELLYISLRNISFFYQASPTAITVDASVIDFQVDNQLFGTSRPLFLYISPTAKRDVPDNTPAIHVAAHKVPNHKWNAEIYKHLIISIRKLHIQIEERLLWKLFQFAEYSQAEIDMQKIAAGEQESEMATTPASAVQEKRYYFGNLKINTSWVMLSMLTVSRLSPELKIIKKSTSIPLVNFEELKVLIDPFVRHNPFEPRSFLLREIKRHYVKEIKGQVMIKILGSVNFLGNPAGFLSDMSEGISDLINDGNVAGLVKNVAHGVSNTAAKMTGSLSDTLNSLNMDAKHNEERDRLKLQHGSKSSDHLLAGIKGFGFGIYGGLTSLIKLPIEGGREEGVEGFVKGIGKGVIGTITKPVSGILDLASGAANAVRDTSRRSSHIQPSPVRKPRCCYGPGGLLQAYSEKKAKYQELLYELNKNKYDEIFIVLEKLRSSPETISALITSKQVYFLGRPDNDVFLHIPHENLETCYSSEKDGRCYLEILMKSDGYESTTSLKHPQIRCNSKLTAQKVCQQIMYAKSLYDEQKHTLEVTEQLDDLDE